MNVITLKKILGDIPYRIEHGVIYFTKWKTSKPNEWQILKLLDEGYILSVDLTKEAKCKDEN
jgi:hypothetical protein